MPIVTCGIDWAKDHHDIALVNAYGQLVAKRRIPESVAGFTELTTMLADAGDDPEDPIPVAIETPRGLLVAVLRATGRPIYPINPMSVARYRERTSMSGKKSDHTDAVTLANILRTDIDQHRRLPADTELAQSITVLARAHQDATWRRNRAGNELRSLLREYFPGLLHVFADRPGGITSPGIIAPLVFMCRRLRCGGYRATLLGWALLEWGGTHALTNGRTCWCSHLRSDRRVRQQPRQRRVDDHHPIDDSASRC